MKRILFIALGGFLFHCSAEAQVTPDSSRRAQTTTQENKKMKSRKSDKTMDHNKTTRDRRTDTTNAQYGVSPERSGMDTSGTGISSMPGTRMTDSAAISGRTTMNDTTGIGGRTGVTDSTMGNMGTMGNTGSLGNTGRTGDTLNTTTSNPAFGNDTTVKSPDPMIDANKKVKTKTPDMKTKQKPGKSKVKHNKDANRNNNSENTNSSGTSGSGGY